MKKYLNFVLVLCFVPFLVTNAQHRGQSAFKKPHEDYQQILANVNIDSMMRTVRHLSGEEPFMTPDGPDTILSRSATSEGIYKAQLYLKNKLKMLGYAVDHQQFSITKYLGDINFAPDDQQVGWCQIDGNIYHTKDGGQTWSLQITPPHPDCNLFVVNKDVAFGIGYIKGFFARTLNGGENWDFQDSLSFVGMEGIYFIDKDRGWICGKHGKISFTDDGGLSWQEQVSPTPAWLTEVFFINDSTGWIGGLWGTLLYTSNGGKSWVEKTLPEENISVRKIYFISQEKGFIIGSGGTILKTEDGGAGWEIVPLNINKSFNDMDFADSLNGTIVGSEGTILQTRDGGTSWNLLPNSIHNDIRFVEYNTLNYLWVVGNEVFQYSKNNGQNWTSIVEEFEVDQYNLIGTKYGVTYPDSFFILCAHYDSRSSWPLENTRAPGADDNASGTAAVIEAARILNSHTFDYTISFVLFAAEEVGFKGSEYFVGKALTDKIDITGVINLDMIAYDGNNDGMMEIHARETDSSQILAQEIMNNISAWNLDLIPKLDLTGWNMGSDQMSFWEKGLPALGIIEDREDFAPGYHTIYDLSTDFNTTFYLNNSRLVITSLAKFAQLDQNTFVQNFYSNANKFTLYEPYPNPFNQETVISYQLEHPAHINISIYNINGQRVETLLDKNQTQGAYKVTWSGMGVGTGIYFIRMKTDEQVFVKKCTVLK